MAKAGSERLFGNGVADCSAHATALLSEYLLFETITLMLKTWMTQAFFLAMGEQWGVRGRFQSTPTSDDSCSTP